MRILSECYRILPLILNHNYFTSWNQKASLLYTMSHLYFLGKFYADQRCSFRLLGYKLHSDKPLTAYLMIEEIFLRAIYEVSLKSAQPLILDAGANIGMALFYFKYRYPSAQIIAFEPQPELFSILGRNVKRNNLTGITLINGCLAAESDQMKLFRSKSALNHSLLNLSSKSEYDWVKGYQLSKWLSHMQIDLVKIDIEGAETEVLLEVANKNLLNKSTRYIIEFHGLDHSSNPNQLIELFHRAEFQSEHRNTNLNFMEFSDRVWSFEKLDDL